MKIARTNEKKNGKSEWFAVRSHRIDCDKRTEIKNRLRVNGKIKEKVRVLKKKEKTEK